MKTNPDEKRTLRLTDLAVGCAVALSMNLWACQEIPETDPIAPSVSKAEGEARPARAEARPAGVPTGPKTAEKPRGMLEHPKDRPLAARPGPRSPIQHDRAPGEPSVKVRREAADAGEAKARRSRAAVAPEDVARRPRAALAPEEAQDEAPEPEDEVDAEMAAAVQSARTILNRAVRCDAYEAERSALERQEETLRQPQWLNFSDDPCQLSANLDS